MAIAEKMADFMDKSSWIRKMFEEAARLKAIHGEDNVFDFSIGNPNLDPPAEFKQGLKQIAQNPDPGLHAYMPNPGYPHTRKAVADYLSAEHGADISGNEIIMTCGAAGGLNITLKAILNSGEEVITPAPYFMEYFFYVDNHGGRLVPVPARSDFTMDVSAIEAAVTEKTRAVLINSPNNPTGQVYPEENLRELADCISAKSGELGRCIYLISDEPYKKIVYDGIRVPSIFSCYSDSIIATSYSKDLSLPGERIGFTAVNPKASEKQLLLDAMTLTNRILGFINAPALMQRVVADLQGVHVDISEYERKRRLMCEGLSGLGYRFIRPSGAFYLFPESPVKDDLEFIRALQDELILAVPGSGFGGPGYFRLSFCVSDRTIIDAMPGFERAINRFSG
ncbi:MAG: pyridoxal phosphate-dependent aminotransferase [Desulfobacteraceae bacterium]|nr:pyridoxal phosphate-dependent aminotransferase [Desulfobacteraceae bacterium]MCF8094983.1 pyridoxal phosphate-dependent aminotransferase [Desulfobacteraceae bacterium]